jgi:hypothetical protein
MEEPTMNGNIISAVSQFLTPDLIGKIASAAGISDGSLARKAMGAATPAILSGLASLASKPDGARQVSDAVARQAPNALEALASSLGSSGRLADTGQNLLTSLLGGTSFSSLASAIGKFAGVGDGAVRSLLGMLTPVVLGLLGREAGSGATGVSQYLASQKDHIAAAMPSGLSDLLRNSGFPAASPVAPMARTDDVYRAPRERDAVDPMAQAISPSTPRSSTWAYWVLPLLALAGLGWFIFGGEKMDSSVAVAPAAAPQDAPQSSDLGRQITAAIDQLNTSLQAVKDRASTPDASAKLQQGANELDRLSGLASRLPAEARDRLAATIIATTARLKSTLDTMNAAPNTPPDVKTTIAALQTKLDGLATRVAYYTTAPKDAVTARGYFDHDVYNNNDEKIGVVKDLIVGPDGRIAAAVVGVGGFLGLGEKDVAMTFSAIRITPRDNDWRLVTDATKDALKEAPTFEGLKAGTRPNPGADSTHK